MIALAAGLAPGTAAAAPFAELPPSALNGVGTCLQATGAPDELLHDAGESVDLLRAGPAGFAPAGAVPAGGEHFACPSSSRAARRAARSGRP